MASSFDYVFADANTILDLGTAGALGGAGLAPYNAVFGDNKVIITDVVAREVYRNMTATNADIVQRWMAGEEVDSTGFPDGRNMGEYSISQTLPMYQGNLLVISNEYNFTLTDRTKLRDIGSALNANLFEGLITPATYKDTATSLAEVAHFSLTNNLLRNIELDTSAGAAVTTQSGYDVKLFPNGEMILSRKGSETYFVGPDQRVAINADGVKVFDNPQCFAAGTLIRLADGSSIPVRRQMIWLNSGRRLVECWRRLGVDVKRRACGAASGDVRWFVA